jgi:tRNA G26 N,N-dimethylase Trm1
MIEVFKTNVARREQAAKLLEVLENHFPVLKINFDLEDCDKILRVKGSVVAPERIINVITSNGYQCSVLE